MTRSNPLVLLLAAIAGGAGAWALEVMLVTGGAAAFSPSPAFAITLAVLAVAVLVVAWPVRRYTAGLRAARDARMRAERTLAGSPERAAAEAAGRSASQRRVDPFRAVYALAFAKASSLAGAIFIGAALGIVAFLLTRTVVGGGVGAAVLAAAGALLLLAAGLVAESWCALPPDAGESETAEATPAAG